MSNSDKKKKRHSQNDGNDNEANRSKKLGQSSSKSSNVEESEDLEKQEEVRRRLASRQEDVKKLLAIKKEEALKNKKRLGSALSEVPCKKKAAEDNEKLNSVTDVSVEESQDKLPLIYKPDLPPEADVPSPGVN